MGNSNNSLPSNGAALAERKPRSRAMGVEDEMIIHSQNKLDDDNTNILRASSFEVSPTRTRSKERPPLLTRSVSDDSCSSPGTPERPRRRSDDYVVDLVLDSISRRTDYFSQGLKRESECMHADAIESFRKFLESNPHHSQAHKRIGIIQWKRGCYDDALIALEQALSLQLAENTPSFDELADIYLSMGKVQQSMGRYIKAKKTLKKAMSFIDFVVVQGKIEAPDHSKLLLAQILTALGRVYDVLHKYDTALGYLQDAIWIQKEAVGDTHPDIATSLFAFGSLLSATLSHDRALECFNEALCIFRTRNDHLFDADMAVTLTSIGWTLYCQGKLTEALSKYEEALSLHESLHGESPHRNVASTLVEIGMVCLKLDRNHEALLHLKRALRMQRQVLGDNHADVALTLCLSAMTFEKLHMLDEATKFLHHAIQIRSVVFGPRHLLVATALMQLGELTKDYKSFETALTIYEANGLGLNDKRVKHVRMLLSRDRPASY